MPKVSIIVPVYGVERYIERCARSLFEQSFKGDMEFVFVNDKTKDNSIALLQEVINKYPSRQSQVRIINHSENMGLPQARRTGMLAAEGEYIISVDSDDWINPVMVEKLLDRVDAEKSDIVIYDYAVVDDSGTVSRTLHGCQCLKKQRFIKDMCAMRVSWSACNKMFKRSLLSQDIVFPRRNMGEDMALMTQIVLASRVISYEPTVMYYYYTNPNSMTQAPSEKDQLEKYRQLSENTMIALAAFERNRLEKTYSSSMVALKWNLRKRLWGLVYKKDYYKMWKNTYPEIEYKLLFNNQISKHDKLCYLLTLLGMYPRNKHRVLG